MSIKVASLKLKSSGIFVVMLFAFCGYYFTYACINRNLIQYSSLPKSLSVKVPDAGKKSNDFAVFNFPVQSKQPPYLVLSKIPPSTAHTEALVFHYNAIFLVWLFLICIMMGITSGSIPVFLREIVTLTKEFKMNKKQVGASIATALLVLLFLLLTNQDLKGYYKPENIIRDFNILLRNAQLVPNIVLVTVGMLLPIIIVIFLVGFASDNLNPKTPDAKALQQTAFKFEKLYRVLNNALQVLATIVVFSVLTSSALQLSIKGTFMVTGYDIFPPYISYLYGLYFTVFLALIYVPSYMYLKHRYQCFRNEMMTSEAVQPEIAAHVLGLVKNENSFLDNLKMAMSLLAPLLSSFLPDALSMLK